MGPRWDLGLPVVALFVLELWVGMVVMTGGPFLAVGRLSTPPGHSSGQSTMPSRAMATAGLAIASAVTALQIFRATAEGGSSEERARRLEISCTTSERASALTAPKTSTMKGWQTQPALSHAGVFRRTFPTAAESNRATEELLVGADGATGVTI